MVMSKRDGKKVIIASLVNLHIDLTPMALREHCRQRVVRDVILSQLLVKVNKWFPKAQANTFSIRFRHHQIYLTHLKIVTSIKRFTFLYTCVSNGKTLRLYRHLNSLVYDCSMKIGFSFPVKILISSTELRVLLVKLPCLFI